MGYFKLLVINHSVAKRWPLLACFIRGVRAFKLLQKTYRLYVKNVLMNFAFSAFLQLV